MSDMRKVRELHEAWWRRENTVPLVENYYPLALPCGGLDIDVPVTEIAARKLRNAEVAHNSPAGQDSLVVAVVDFGTALYPAVAGAGIKSDGVTSWSIHTAEFAADVRIDRFDPLHPLYVEYQRRLEEVLAHWSWDAYLPAVCEYAGPFDILAGILGAENLALELYEAPEDVLAAAVAAEEFMCGVIEHEKALFASAGLTGGMATRFGTWQPGWSALYIEDFSALIGPDLYREFILQFDARMIRHFDSVLFHTHSAGFRNIPAMLELPDNAAFEFGNDPNGPDTNRRIATGRAILEAGRPLIFGSWNVPLAAAEIEAIVRQLPPQGLNLRFQCASAQEALELYHLIKSMGRAG